MKRNGDIFGKSVHDYPHLMALKDKGMLETYLHDKAADAGHPQHNFHARDALQVNMTDFEANAQAITYVTNNLQAIQAQIESILYTKFRADRFVPFVTNVPEGATTYGYRVTDRAGRGKFIEPSGTNAESASVAMRLVAYKLRYGGIVPEWSLENLRVAMFGGVPLDTETIVAGTKGAMDHIEQVAITGDAEEGLLGLINQTSVAVNAAAKTIDAMTPNEMLQFLQDQATKIIEDTEEVAGLNVTDGLCFYLPISQSAKVFTTRLPDTSMSVWQYFAMNNSWTSYTGNQVMLKWVKELDKAGVASVDRMMVTFCDTLVMEMAMPISPRVISAMQQNYSVQAPMEYKISGLNFKRPGLAFYVDGV